jgi:hypothetical protein
MVRYRFVHRRCIPNKICRSGVDTTIAQSDSRKQKIICICVLGHTGYFLVPLVHTQRIVKCPLNPSTSVNIEECEVFAALGFDQGHGSPDTMFRPVGVEVDTVNRIVYITNFSHYRVHIFDYEGNYIRRLEESKGDMMLPSRLATQPGIYPPLSTIIPQSEMIAGMDLVVPITLNDHNNQPIDYVLSELEIGSICIVAIGTTTFDGVDIIVPYLGDMLYDASLPQHEAFTGTINLRRACNYKVKVTVGYSPLDIMVQRSYFDLTVHPSITDATYVQTSFDQSGTADERYIVTIFPQDQYNNPTSHESDEFYGSFEGGDERQFHREVDDITGFVTFVFNETMSEAGDYLLYVVFKDGVEVRNSPFHFVVLPSSFSEEETDLKGLRIALLTAVFIFLSCWGFVRRRQSRMNRQVHDLRDAEQKKQKEIELGIRRIEMLNSENNNLNESLKRNKHSESELQVMAKAMEALTAERSDELRGVLIESKAVKIKCMIGKGGCGIVYLGVWKKQEIAVKQLLTINENSVKRFRFECFIMKNLRHPNIIKLIGVCWDEMMLGCCIELVRNGNLKDWLMVTTGDDEDNSTTATESIEEEARKVDFTWKGNLLEQSRARNRTATPSEGRRVLGGRGIAGESRN